MISFFVPGTPRGWQRTRHNGRTGTFFNDKVTANAEANVAFHGAKALHEQRYDLLEGPLALTVIVHCPIAASWSNKKRQEALAKPLTCTSKPDLDNCVKLVMDGLNRVVWRDDRQVVQIVASKVYSDKPGTAVEIREVK